MSDVGTYLHISYIYIYIYNLHDNNNIVTIMHFNDCLHKCVYIYYVLGMSVLPNLVRNFEYLVLYVFSAN